jgi:hypothetical protein
MQPFFHIGILVADLDEAIADFGRIFKVRFNPPSVVHVGMVWKATTMELDVRVSYSVDGPPYLELIEGHETGYYSLERGEGIHHVGLWVPDLEKTMSAAERFKMLHIDATLPNKASGCITSMSAPASLHGVRLELIDERRRPGIEAWINGGNFES